MTLTTSWFTDIREFEARLIYAEYLDNKPSPLMSFEEFCVHEGYLEDADQDNGEDKYRSDAKEHGTLFEYRNRKMGS